MMEPANVLGCMDCGKPYSSFPLDVTIPDDQWRQIHDSKGGVLCANCMVARLSRLPGAIAVRARLEVAADEVTASATAPAWEPMDRDEKPPLDCVLVSDRTKAVMAWLGEKEPQLLKFTLPRPKAPASKEGA